MSLLRKIFLGVGLVFLSLFFGFPLAIFMGADSVFEVIGFIGLMIFVTFVSLTFNNGIPESIITPTEPEPNVYDLKNWRNWF